MPRVTAPSQSPPDKRGGNASSRGRESRRRSAITLLQRTQDLMLECRAVAQQFRKSSAQKNRPADFAERNAYAVLVAALDGGLMFTLHNAVDLLWKPLGTLGDQWLNEQDEQGPEGQVKPTDGFAKNC